MLRRNPAIRFFATLAIVFSCLSVQALSAQTSANPGVAIVTSAKGKPSLQTDSGRSDTLKLHSTHSLKGQTFVTGKKSHAFLACSNGLGIGIDSESDIYFESFTQVPFDEMRAALEFEPSISELHGELRNGAIALASKGLSPRSQTIIQTSVGSIRVHSASCIIEHSVTGTTILVYEGNVAFYYTSGVDREYVSKGTGIRISEQSAAFNKVAEEIDIESIDGTKQLFAKAAQNAPTRVHFKAPLAGQSATPILIAPTSYFEQDSVRPYQFSD